MAAGPGPGTGAGRQRADRGEAAGRSARHLGRGPLSGEATGGPPPIEEEAPAKINLHLHVTGRRADGYHLLDSLVVFAGAGDRVTVRPSRTLGLSVGGPEGEGLSAGDDNLVLRAARAMAAVARERDSGRRVTRGAALRLEKRLPVASGIGGGSADAAATLRALDQLWGLDLGEARLREIGAGLGADVPVCVASRPAVMGGTGEVMRPAPSPPPFGLLLANPRVALPTPSVFRARRGEFSSPAVLPPSWPDAAAMASDLRGLRNDLETAALSLCPPVGDVLSALSALPGALLARMSGSGATCFALFADPAAAEQGAALLPASWWRWAGAPRRPV